MTKIIINHINNSDKYSNKREALGVSSGIAGIICNIFLCVMKFVVGSLSGSISITADALNNLSDAASNIVTITGTKLSNKPVDKEHPFGHGRLEYVSALVVSFLIFIMSFELGKSSIEKIISPEDVSFNIWFVVVLVIAICVKLWMAFFNHKLYKETNNVNLKAVKQDSLNDCIATSSTILALLLSHFFNLSWLDGAIGLAVSVFILISGIGIVKEILGPLLGQAPPKETVDEIENIIKGEDVILGVHDLIIHDYGANRVIASAHAEVPAHIDVMELHDAIDRVEKEIFDRLKIDICIHMDPVIVDDEHLQSYQVLMEEVIKEYNENYSLHDFRIVRSGNTNRLVFDLTIPFEEKKETTKIYEDILKLSKEKDQSIELSINIEHSYI